MTITFDAKISRPRRFITIPPGFDATYTGYLAGVPTADTLPPGRYEIRDVMHADDGNLHLIPPGQPAGDYDGSYFAVPRWQLKGLKIEVKAVARDQEADRSRGKR